MRRVVVTGLGVVSPVGVGVDAFWSSLVQGVSGVGRIGAFDASAFASQIAGEVREFDPLTSLPARDVVRTDRYIQFALAAAAQAIADAKLAVEAAPDRIGVSIGTAFGGIATLTRAYDTLGKEGPDLVSAYAMPAFLPNMAAGWVSMRLGARGPIAAASTACAAGSQAIGDAYQMIAHGEAEAMIAGGAEAPVTPIIVACFAALKALSTHNDEPARASRPFDRDRDGFVLAEGSGILVLEERQRALDRGAHVYAEVVGYGLAADAHHPTAPTVDGPARAMRRALAGAGLAPGEIAYINAHGTSTPRNDLNETRAIKDVFGPAAASVAISSIKSMTGHLIGAAGAIEAIATLLAIERGVIPPTINYAVPDPECDLDYVPNHARAARIPAALSNSFAFGGTNTALVFRAVR